MTVINYYKHDTYIVEVCVVYHDNIWESVFVKIAGKEYEANGGEAAFDDSYKQFLFDKAMSKVDMRDDVKRFWIEGVSKQIYTNPNLSL